jgi:hypothetical protein
MTKILKKSIRAEFQDGNVVYFAKPIRAQIWAANIKAE